MFVNSAEILYDNRKYEEALCLVCIAMDACSSNQYRNKKNAERYKLFLKEHFSTIYRYGFPGIEASSIRIKVNILNAALKPSGNKAYIMNMYTNPEYRRQGIAYKTLDMLIRDIKNKGITAISLEETDMGRPLYEKYGFVKMNDEMELPE